MVFLTLSVFYLMSNILILIFLLIFGIPILLIWKKKGIVLFLLSISIDFVFIFFHESNPLYNILAITSIFFIAIVFDHYYDITIRQLMNRYSTLKKHQDQFIDEIIKKSQFKSIFVSTVSHDLRSPLNAILGFSDLLLQIFESKLDEKAILYLKTIYEAGEELLELIDKLIDISKIDTGKLQLILEKIEINEFIFSIIKTIDPLFKNKDIHFEYQPNLQTCYLNADKLKLKEILIKLLVNSIEYMHSGYICLKVIENEKYTKFEILDDGLGLKNEELDFIFRPFKKWNLLKIKYIRESNFGLMLAKRLIEIHQGKLNIINTNQNYTIINFSIPKSLQISES